METLTPEQDSQTESPSSVVLDGETRMLRPDEIVMRNIEARKALEAGRC